MNEISKNYIGNPKQLNEVRLIQFLEGKASGMKAYEVCTESGLQMTILLDRGMDISTLKIKGTNIGFMSSTGLVNSTYFVEDKDKGFMNNFTVGFLTTGGLSYMGSSSMNHGLHGVISNTPAENFGYKILKDQIVISGDIHDARMFGQNLCLHRKIKISTLEPKFEIEDRIKNLSDVRSPYMVLYHNNYGYPFFDEKALLKMDTKKTTDRNGNNCKLVTSFVAPSANKPEKVYFNKLNNSKYILKSPKTNLQINVSISLDTLPIVNQWILERKRNYVLGIEPATNNVNGYAEAKKDGNLKYLEPDEEVSFDLKYHFQKLGVNR